MGGDEVGKSGGLSCAAGSVISHLQAPGLQAGGSAHREPCPWLPIRHSGIEGPDPTASHAETLTHHASQIVDLAGNAVALASAVWPLNRARLPSGHFKQTCPATPEIRV